MTEHFYERSEITLHLNGQYTYISIFGSLKWIEVDIEVWGLEYGRKGVQGVEDS